MAFLWSLVVVDPLIILSTILCGCVSIVCTLFDKSGNIAIYVARFWARSLLVFAGVKVRVEGLEKIHPDGHYVFCANHLSYMDTPVVLGRMPAVAAMSISGFWGKQKTYSVPSFLRASRHAATSARKCGSVLSRSRSASGRAL